MDMGERRNFERMVRSASISYRRMEYIVDDEMLDGTMLDCSSGGVRFTVTETYMKNDQLLMELEFDGWVDNGEKWLWTDNGDDIGVLRVIGAVMWCKKSSDLLGNYEVGVRFTGRVKAE